MDERLARIEVEVKHIGALVEKADGQRDQSEARLRHLLERIIRLEAQAVEPAEVHRNSIEAAITKALRENGIRLIGWAIAAGGLTASVVFGVLSLLI